MFATPGRRAVAVRSALIATLVLVSLSTARTQELNSFETASNLAMVHPYSGGQAAATSAYGVTNGSQALKITFPAVSYPGVAIDAPSGLWNFSTTGGLAMDVTNPNDSVVQFSVRIEDINGLEMSEDLQIEPAVTATFRIVFINQSMLAPSLYGMYSLPSPYPSTRPSPVGFTQSPDLTRIARVKIYSVQPLVTTSIAIDNLRLLAGFSGTGLLNGAIDKYGQYTKRSWPNKLTSDSDFATRLANENAQIAAHPTLPGRDAYGGWSAGPTLATANFFYTTQVNGKWWLVTPSGHLFFSLGMDSIDVNAIGTVTSNRDYMFTWAPPNNDPLWFWTSYTASQGYIYNYFGANVQRKYGSNFSALWQQHALARLKYWGFNTIGNFSDSSFYGNGSVPYTAYVKITGNFASVNTDLGADHPMPDPYDQKFAAACNNQLAAATKTIKNDPYCLGYFVDNELGWNGHFSARYTLAYSTLALNASLSPAKQAFVSQLETEYSTIDSFNTAWGVNLASWTALQAPFTAPGVPNTAQSADMSAFTLAYAQKYFSTVSYYLKHWDPKHLYLGCRFAWSRWGSHYFTPEVLQAAAQYCDVLSFNIYDRDLNDPQWAALSGLNRPLMATEFSFGAIDRGMFWPGTIVTGNQTARGAAYQNYVNSALDNPLFVGCHWFRYTDVPNTGAASAVSGGITGDNSNYGFVDVTDTPYPEMVQAAIEVHTDAYTERYNGG